MDNTKLVGWVIEETVDPEDIIHIIDAKKQGDSINRIPRIMLFHQKLSDKTISAIYKHTSDLIIVENLSCDLLRKAFDGKIDVLSSIKTWYKVGNPISSINKSMVANERISYNTNIYHGGRD